MLAIKAVIQKHPSFSKGFVSGVLLSASDAITQLAIEKTEFDWKRNLEFLVLGLGWLAPCIEVWYSNLLPRITARYLSHLPKPQKIICRVVIDTLVFAPVSYTGFYLLKDVLYRKKRDYKVLKKQFNEKFIPTLVADWIVWAPVNFANFWWVPVQWQGLCVGIVSFFFNVLLSYLANKQIQHEQEYKQKHPDRVQKQDTKQVVHQHRQHEKLQHLKQVIKQRAHAKNIEILI